jgi:hypothetical protein
MSCKRRQSDELPKKFTAAERRAYQWLLDCKVRPWTVDLLTKRVKTLHGEYESLVAYREHLEQRARRVGEEC